MTQRNTLNRALFLSALFFTTLGSAQEVATGTIQDDLMGTIDWVVEQAKINDPDAGEFRTQSASDKMLAQADGDPLFVDPFLIDPAVPVGSGEDSVVLSADKSGITLNFQDADIGALVSLVAKTTGKNFIVDPRVKGKVTLVSGSPVPADTLYDIFLAVLATYNFAAIPSGNLIKIIPGNLVKQNPTPTITEGELPNNEQEITYIVTLEHASVNELLPILRPLLPPTAHIAPHAGSNTLILTDRANNIRRVLSLIQRMDQEQQGQEIRVIYLKHANANTLAQVVSQLAGTLSSDDAAKGLPVQQTLVQVDEGLNALIVRAPEKDFPVLAALIEQLDVDRPEKGDVHVRYLKYAQAENLVTLLNGIIQDKQAQSTDGTAAPSVKISVQADEVGNSLIIHAEEEDYKDLTTVIDQLDIRRAQVFVEAIIAEVSEDDGAEIGVKWEGLYRNNDNQEFSAGDNFASSEGGGFNLGFINKYVRNLAGDVVPDLNAVLRVLREDSNSNIISTPSMLTLDNETAEIVVGQEVPFVTGRFTNNNTTTDGSGNVVAGGPFQTIERKEVGLSLKITPQINEGGAIQLEIEQETSNVNTTTVSGATDLITDKRTINANVLVDDGQIIVLGGLISSNASDTYERIPILGSLPLIGSAFRRKTKETTKTNLMVFLRPTIIRTPSELDQLTRDRYQYMRTEEFESLPDTRGLIDNPLPVLREFVPNISEAVGSGRSS